MTPYLGLVGSFLSTVRQDRDSEYEQFLPVEQDFCALEFHILY